MKLIKFKITPLSSFSTFIKGDMLFSYFAYLNFQENDKLKDYLSTPSIIFSDFLPDGYLPKPALPLESFDVDDSEKKEFRKKEWISIENLQSGNFNKCEKIEFFVENILVKNSINRKSFSTDESGIFAPYSMQEIKFLTNVSCFVMYDENIFNENEILSILKKMGTLGIGKKSSIGKGQFNVEIDKTFKGFKNIDSKYNLTISPTIPTKKSYYNIFNKFGKYSFSNTPYKKPVIMADSGAVVIGNKLEYTGKSIDNGIERPSFLQGYSITIPFKFDGKGLI